MIPSLRELRRPNHPRRANPARRRRGYSFPEVLFAVVVLGIGFIMIAAVFPVAIQQSKATADETIGATAARAGVATVSALGRQDSPTLQFKMLPVTSTGTGTQGDVAPLASQPLSEESWRMIRGNLIFPQDPRYAYVPLYRRNGTVTAPAPTAQIYIITVQCRSTLRPAGAQIQSTNPQGQNTTKQVPLRTNQEFDYFDFGVRLDTGTTPYTNANNLAPRRVKIKEIKDNPAGDTIDVLTFDMTNQKTAEPNQNLPKAAAQGCFVIMHKTGQIYRLGAPRDEANGIWELIPGSDLPGLADEVSNVDAFVVGREWIAPYGPNDFIGTGQDISIFTTFIPVAQ